MTNNDPMNYIELHIKTQDSTHSEILMAELSDLPFESFEQEEDHLNAYIRADNYETYRSEVEQYLDSEGLEWRLTNIEAQNWNELWESNFDPVDVDGRCLIRAPFHSPASDSYEFEVVIMPKMSFGTGHHATTYLSVAQIMKSDLKGLRGLDIGCGTGILSIVAIKCGAQRVDAVDIDEWSYNNCLENVVDNGVADRITPMIGDVSAVSGGRYDFIMANINLNVLLNDMENYSRLLKSDGMIIMSGILEADIETLTDCAAQYAMHPIDRRVRSGWAVVVFQMAEAMAEDVSDGDK